MRAICVDDEKLLMEHTVSMCAELPQIDEVKGIHQAERSAAMAGGQNRGSGAS